MFNAHESLINLPACTYYDTDFTNVTARCDGGEKTICQQQYNDLSFEPMDDNPPQKADPNFITISFGN